MTDGGNKGREDAFKEEDIADEDGGDEAGALAPPTEVFALCCRRMSTPKRCFCCSESL